MELEVAVAVAVRSVGWEHGENSEMKEDAKEAVKEDAKAARQFTSISQTLDTTSSTLQEPVLRGQTVSQATHNLIPSLLSRRFLSNPPPGFVFHGIFPVSWF
jgi:hypothetical protein